MHIHIYIYAHNVYIYVHTYNIHSFVHLYNLLLLMHFFCICGKLTGQRTGHSFFSLCCHNQFVELFKIGDQDSFIAIALCIQPNVSEHTPARCLFAVIFHQSRNEQRLQTLPPIYYQWRRGKEKNCLSK